MSPAPMEGRLTHTVPLPPTPTPAPFPLETPRVQEIESYSAPTQCHFVDSHAFSLNFENVKSAGRRHGGSEPQERRRAGGEILLPKRKL